jgi:hypothetical protein
MSDIKNPEVPDSDIPNPEDLIPEYFFSPAEGSGVNKNKSRVIVPVSIVDPDVLASVDPKLIKKVKRKVDDMFYPLAFPIDVPYIVEYIIKASQEGISDPKEIARDISVSLVDERPEEDVQDFFELEPKIALSISRALSLAHSINNYIRYATENKGYLREVKSAGALLGSLLYMVLMDSSVEDMDLWDFRPPGDQIIFISRPALFAMVRVLESGARLFESGLWETDLYWAVALRRDGARVREEIADGDEINPTL